MGAKNWWQLLREGINSPIAELEAAYELEPTPSYVMTLGVAYLWIGSYPQARDHFRAAIRKYHRRMSSFFGMAGAAEWCLGEQNNAVELWREGLFVDFADGAGGIQNPLLLLYASLVGSAFPESEALAILAERLADRRAVNWPGQLGKYVLNAMAGNSQDDPCNSVDDDGLRMQCRWLTEFYAGVLALSRGDRTLFADHLKKSVAFVTTKSLDEKIFTRCLWHEEFFLARHEAYGRNSNLG